MVVLRWLGAAGVELSYEGSVVLLDPYLSRVSKLALLAGRSLKPDMARLQGYLREIETPVESIVVSHTHFDHALDVPPLARLTEARVIGSSSLGTLMRAAGNQDQLTVCLGGETLPLPSGGSVTMLKSRHGLVALGRVPYPGEIDRHTPLPWAAGDYREGCVFAPLVELGGIRILHLGSANFEEEALRGLHCHALLLCVPGWQRVPRFVARLFEMVTAELVIPFHYDDFTAPLDIDRTAPKLPFQGIPKLVAEIRRHAPATRVMLPRPFEVVRL